MSGWPGPFSVFEFPRNIISMALIEKRKGMFKRKQKANCVFTSFRRYLLSFLLFKFINWQKNILVLSPSDCSKCLVPLVENYVQQ